MSNGVGVETASAAPTPVKLGDKTYLLSPLDTRDFGIILRSVKLHMMQLAKDAAEGLPSAEREMLLKHAYDRAAEVQYGHAQVLALMQDIDCITQMVWLSIRKEHPQITLEEVAKLLTNDEAFADANVKLTEMFNSDVEAASNGTDTKKGA